MIQFAKPDMSPSEITRVDDTLKSGWLTHGPKVREFANAVAKHVGADRAVCFDSCTAAMEMSLRVLGVGPGDEVITTPFTYTATAEVIRNVGATIVFCDLEAGSFEMDYHLIEKLITGRTKAIIPVDYGGVPCKYEKLFQAIYNKAGLFIPSTPLQKNLGRVAVIADAAHSFGASYNGFPVGSIADFTCFSFHVLKPITTGGEGGAVTWKNFEDFDNDRLSHTLELLGDHGQTAKGISGLHGREWEYDISLFGYNHIMTDVDASVGLAQLARIESLEDARATLAQCYYEHLPNGVTPGLSHFSNEYKSSMHLFPVWIKGAGENERNFVFAQLQEKGISCNVHYKPLPMFTAYIRAGFDIADYPVTYSAYKNLLTLPYHTGMTTGDVKFVCVELGKAVSQL